MTCERDRTFPSWIRSSISSRIGIGKVVERFAKRCDLRVFIEETKGELAARLYLPIIDGLMRISL